MSGAPEPVGSGPALEADGVPGSPDQRRLIAERVAAAICLAGSVLLVATAESLVSNSSVSRPGAFPPHGALWLAGGVLGVASLVWLVKTFRAGRTVSTERLAPMREVLVMFVILLAGAFAVRWLGLLVAGALTYVLILVYYRDKNKIFVLVSVVGYVLLVHYGMEVMLKVPLAPSPYFDLPF